MKHIRFSYNGNLHRNFALNITLHHNVIETMGTGTFCSSNQSDSHDLCEAVKPRPSNHLEHPSN